MKLIEIELPDDLDLALDASAEEVPDLARLLLAMKLFELGRVTSGQAARIARLSRLQFFSQTHRYGVPAVSWDAEEFEEESAPIG